MAGKTPSWMPELFFCHRKEFCVVADQLGFRLGTRSDQMKTNGVQKLIDSGFTIDFVDNDFEDPDRDRIRSAVDATRSEFVVLPDLYNCSDIDKTRSFGRELVTEYDVTPIIVPKCDVDEDEIPPDWIVGFSVPSGYGETDVPIETWQHHRVHLLGGSPRSQIQYANKAVSSDVDIFSVDGNSFAKASGFGNIINEPVEILDDTGELDNKAWVKDADGYTDWGQRIAVSLSRYYELWRQWSMIHSNRYDHDDIASER